MLLRIVWLLTHVHGYGGNLPEWACKCMLMSDPCLGFPGPSPRSPTLLIGFIFRSNVNCVTGLYNA